MKFILENREIAAFVFPSVQYSLHFFWKLLARDFCSGHRKSSEETQVEGGVCDGEARASVLISPSVCGGWVGGVLVYIKLKIKWKIK